MHKINKKAIILLDNKCKNGIIFVSKRKAMYPHPPDLQNKRVGQKPQTGFYSGYYCIHFFDA